VLPAAIIAVSILILVARQLNHLRTRHAQPTAPCELTRPVKLTADDAM
jgi:hypothetical protein